MCAFLMVRRLLAAQIYRPSQTGSGWMVFDVRSRVRRVMRLCTPRKCHFLRRTSAPALSATTPSPTFTIHGKIFPFPTKSMLPRRATTYLQKILTRADQL